MISRQDFIRRLGPRRLLSSWPAAARSHAVLNAERVDVQQQLGLWRDGEILVDEQMLQAARFLVDLLEG